MKRKKTRKLKKPRAVKAATRRRGVKPAAIAKRKANTKPKAKAKPKAKPDAIDFLVTASAQALKLPLDPAWHGGIKFNLQLILRLGALVDEFPLPDDAEPGPVFHA
jgi:hypothetical protein